MHILPNYLSDLCNGNATLLIHVPDAKQLNAAPPCVAGRRSGHDDTGVVAADARDAAAEAGARHARDEAVRREHAAPRSAVADVDANGGQRRRTPTVDTAYHHDNHTPIRYAHT